MLGGVRHARSRTGSRRACCQPCLACSPVQAAATLLAGLALMAPAALRPEAVLGRPRCHPVGLGAMVIEPDAMDGDLRIHPGDPLKSGPETLPSVQPTPGRGLSLAVGLVSLSRSFDWSLGLNGWLHHR